MRIVDVCAFYSPRGGGVRTYVEQKLKIGPELGHEIVILAPGDRDEVIHRGPQARIVTITSPRLPVDSKYWYFADERALHASLDELVPDFVECASPWRSPSYVARWPGLAPRALIMHHDPFSVYAYRWLHPWLKRETIDRQVEFFWRHMRTLGRSYDRVVCASQDLRERLARGGVANTALHPMGVDTTLFTPHRRDVEVRRQLLELCSLPDSAHLAIGVGRLAAEKRWPVVIDAVMNASQTAPIGLVILGEGGALGRITRHAAGNPHIRLLCPERIRERFAAILASADMFVHAGTCETFGMAAAEARACGLPVIVPDLGAAAEHAQGGGIAYAAGSASSAAQAILSIIARPPIASPGRSRSMHQHFADLFTDYEAIVEDVQRAA